MSTAPDQDSDDVKAVLAEAHAFGMDASSIADLRAELTSESGSFAGVWPEHTAIVTAFAVVCTQWRIIAMGGGFEPSRLVCLGLDYTAARAGLDAAGIAVTPALWRGLRIMEDEATRARNEAD